MSDIDEDFKSYAILAITLVILSFFIGYLIYTSKLERRDSSHMNTLYPSVNGQLRSISSADPDCNKNLVDYYVKTAYNACSGGSYKNDYVSADVLKSVIRTGARCLDFEVYSIENEPVVSTSTNDNFHIKETYNSVPFSQVMDILKSYAFSGGSCPNPTDPMFIHLRFKSNNQKMYAKMAEIFKANTDIMLGVKYSYETDGKNLGNVPLLKLQNKIVLIVDRSNTSFLENSELLEYVNLTSNSIFMREHDYYGIKNNPDMNELIDFNRRGMTFVVPDNGPNPTNPSGIVCRANGCQMVAMRYQYVDNFLMEDTAFFDRAGYAFVLKPDELRFHPVTVKAPEKQKPEYSYATRTTETDYYKFNY